MQPVLYSTKDAEEGQPGWERVGSNICYYKNFYQRKGSGLCANKYFFTATFTVRFPYPNDVCYLAYHYPYTVSMMKVHYAYACVNFNCDSVFDFCRVFVLIKCHFL